MIQLHIAGIIITGGLRNNGFWKFTSPEDLQVPVSVEVYNPLTNKTCHLPDLPEWRYHHSLCRGLICGGGESQKPESLQTCLLLDPRTGRFDYTLVWLSEKRSGHLCWELGGEGGEILLLGGTKSHFSSEVVTHQGRSSTTSLNSYNLSQSMFRQHLDG